MEQDRDQIIPSGLNAEQKPIRGYGIAKSAVGAMCDGSMIHGASPISGL
jgi:hypothetical protein